MEEIINQIIKNRNYHSLSISQVKALKRLLHENKELKENYFKGKEIECPMCKTKIKTLSPIPVIDTYYPDMLITHEQEYLARKRLEEENKKLKNKLREKICFDGHRQFEELKEENKALKNILGQYRLLTYSRFGKTFRVGDNVDDYISKQAIIDIIEELEKRVMEPKKTNYYARLTIGDAINIKSFLQHEILQKSY